METIVTQIVAAVNDVLWNKWLVLLFLLLGSGIYFSIRTNFVQVRKFGEGMRRVFGNIKLFGENAGKDGMSSFQALATAIAAQVGTGNIAGCATALASGGPGAIFWMWISAFFGMSTIYGEAVLAQKYKQTGAHGEVTGGPIYYIKAAFKGKLGVFLAGFFAVAIILALGFMGNMVQSNSIGDAFHTAFGVPKWIMGLLVAGVCAFIFLGGVQRIAAFTEKLVPIMAAIFLLGALVVLAIRIRYIPETFGMIFKYAFNPSAIIGGGIGYALKTAISQGAKRGLFSNEAGMGSTPHAHAQANVAHPHDQGVVAMAGVFIDTFVVLTLNALVIISTLYTSGGPLHECGAAAANTALNKTNLAQAAFGTVFGETFGNMFVAVCLFFFAFSTVLGWNLFGRINANYLFGRKNKKLCNTVYTIIALVFIFLGTLTGNDLAWELTDMFNNLIVLPNALALFALTGMVITMLKEGQAKKLKV